MTGLNTFWAQSPNTVLTRLQATLRGLSGTEARKRLRVYGSNTVKAKKHKDSLTLLLAQFKSPIIMLAAGHLCHYYRICYSNFVKVTGQSVRCSFVGLASNATRSEYRLPKEARSGRTNARRLAFC